MRIPVHFAIPEEIIPYAFATFVFPSLHYSSVFGCLSSLSLSLSPSLSLSVYYTNDGNLKTFKVDYRKAQPIHIMLLIYIYIYKKDVLMKIYVVFFHRNWEDGGRQEKQHVVLHQEEINREHTNQQNK